MPTSSSYSNVEYHPQNSDSSLSSDMSVSSARKFSLSKLKNHLLVDRRVVPGSPVSDFEQDEAKNLHPSESGVTQILPRNDTQHLRTPPQSRRAIRQHDPHNGHDEESDFTETDSDGATVIGADYQMILDMVSSSSIDPVIITTSRGSIISCNNEALHLFGYKRWNIVERNVKILMEDKVAAKHDAYLARYLRTLQVRILGELRGDLRGKKSDGSTFPLQLKVSKLETFQRNGGVTFIGLIRDESNNTELDWAREMIKNSWPQEISYQLMRQPDKEISFKKEVTVAFIDLVNFSAVSEKMPASEMFETLNRIFTTMDKIALKHKYITKLKLIGDCYVCASGCLESDPLSHAMTVLQFCIDVQTYMSENEKFEARCGIATGVACCGVTQGLKSSFDCIGPSVNLASRLSSSSIADPGAITVSEETYNQTKFKFEYLQPREIDVKGIGRTKIYTLKM